MTTASSGTGIVFADRASWLAERRSGIGASEMAAVVGLSPHATPLDIYARKIGAAPEQDETPAMRLGTLLEPVIARLYTEATGNEIGVTQVFRRSTAHPHLFATLDGVSQAGHPVEFKTVGPRSPVWAQLGEEGTDEIPPHWLIQAGQQMLCAEADRVDFGVLLAGQDFRVYTVRREEAIVQAIVREGAAFWGRVERREPPEPTGPNAARLLALLNPPDGSEVELGPGPAAIAAQYREIGETVRDLEKGRDRLKADLLAAMGSASVGRLPDGRRVVRKVVERGAYEVKASKYETLNISKGR